MNDPVLAERLEAAKVSRPDVIVFMAAAAGGILLYLAMHLAGLPQLVESVVIVLIMGGYAFAAFKIPRVRIRLDQAGDNAYYLGLLFTLTSMAVALYEFSAAGGSGTDQIISNFGIALASTIWGILLRVFLHQMRVDPADVENMTRIELSEASTRVRATLDDLIRDFSLFHKEMHQRVNDAATFLTQQYQSTVSSFTQDMSTASTRVLAASEAYESGIVERGTRLMGQAEALGSSAMAAVERLRSVEPPPLKLASRIEKLTERLEGFAATVEQIRGMLETAGQDASGALTRVGQIVSAEQESGNRQARIILDTAEACRGLEAALARTHSTLQDEQSLLRQVEADAAKTSSEAVRACEAANEVLRTLTEATRGLTSIVRHGGPATAPPASQPGPARPPGESPDAPG